jgi:hypothetical protein
MITSTVSTDQPGVWVMVISPFNVLQFCRLLVRSELACDSQGGVFISIRRDKWR